MVELALVIPLLLLVVFAIVDFGIVINTQNEETNLANLGVRAVAVLSTSSTPPTCGTSTSLKTYLQCEGQSDGLGNVRVYPTSSGSSWTAGDSITICVDSTFNWLGFLSGNIAGLGATSTIRGSATMRMEGTNSGEPTWVSSGADVNCN